MKCDLCKKEISNEETYYELQEWQMEDCIGGELGDIRLCSSCYEKVKEFINHEQ